MSVIIVSRTVYALLDFND